MKQTKEVRRAFAIRDSKRKALGRLGENVTKKLLIEKGFRFIEATYRKKCGELDLVMEKDGKTCFFEVKTVSREMFLDQQAYISRETSAEKQTEGEQSIRPEENMTHRKLARITRTINMWLMEHNCDENTDWSFHVALVYCSQRHKKFYVKMLWNVIL